MKSFKIYKPIITYVIFIFLSVLSYTILINEKSKSTKKDLNSKVSVETQFKLRLFNVPGFNDQLNYFSEKLKTNSANSEVIRYVEGNIYGYEEIYVLGFDYQGHNDPKQNNRYKFNNVFKDTRNYKRSVDEATFYGNWMNQTKRCLADFKEIKFYRVCPEGAFKPKDLEWNENLGHMNTKEFVELFKLTQRPT